MNTKTVDGQYSGERFVHWGRSVAIAAACLVGAGYFAMLVDRFYPMREWMFFRYLRVWSYLLLFCVSSLASGWAAGLRLMKERIAPLERFVISFAIGVLVFFLGVFGAGCFNLYRPSLFLLLPGLLLVVGGTSVLRDCLCRRGRLTLAWPRISSWMPQNGVQLIAALLLVGGVVAVYLQVMLPRNIGSDSHWYHLPIAEGYVAAGGIRRFDEGWYIGAYPHLASFLYVWAFLAPGQLIDRVLLCTHLEFALFLVTLAAISSIVARLVDRPRVAYAAATVFLFPKLLIYDSNLNGGADHVLAFWCAVLLLVVIRLASRFGARGATVAALIAAGAALTKYQALFVLVPTALVLVGLSMRRQRLRPLLVFGVVCLLATAPHWLKNWIYYHDPVYPFLHRYCPSKPFHEGAEQLAREVFWPKQFDLTGPPDQRWTAVLRALVTFSFKPNDWGFHDGRPEFGSLFTLLVPVLLFLRAPWRLWTTVVAIHVGVGVWFTVNHQDRFLQCLVPAMASIVAATLWLAWQRGWIARTGVSLLVLLQGVWGLDAIFIPVHNMLGDSPFHELGAYLAAGYRGEYEQRYRLPDSYEYFAPHLPKGSKLLLHRLNTRLGLGVQAVNDEPGLQGGIEYLHRDTPEDSAELLRGYGITHAIWFARRESMSPAILAREAVFSRMASEYFSPNSRVNEYRMGAFRSRPHHAEAARTPTRIAWLDCHGERPLGVYSPWQLASRGQGTRFDGELTRDSARQQLVTANAVIVRAECSREYGAFQGAASEFVPMEVYGDVTIWVRTASK